MIDEDAFAKVSIVSNPRTLVIFVQTTIDDNKILHQHRIKVLINGFINVQFDLKIFSDAI